MKCFILILKFQLFIWIKKYDDYAFLSSKEIWLFLVIFWLLSRNMAIFFFFSVTAILLWRCDIMAKIMFLWHFQLSMTTIFWSASLLGFVHTKLMQAQWCSGYRCSSCIITSLLDKFMFSHVALTETHKMNIYKNERVCRGTHAEVCEIHYLLWCRSSEAFNVVLSKFVWKPNSSVLPMIALWQLLNELSLCHMLHTRGC